MAVFARRLYRFYALLLVFCVCCSLLPQAASAQEPAPPVPAPSDYGLQPLNGQADQAAATTSIDDGSTVASADAGVAAPSAAPSVVDASVQRSDVLSATEQAAPIDMNAPVLAAAPQATNDVRVDVSVPAEVRAGQTIDYTYIYTNTKSATTDIKLAVTWNNFSTAVNGNWQFCLASTAEAGCVPNSVVGPAAVKDGTCTTSGCTYKVSQLPGNSAGRFSVRLSINRDRYPRTGGDIQRPASSAQLFMGTEASVTSQDTANTLIVGPVLVLKKAAAEPGKKIYATKDGTPRAADANEQSIFVISLSNGNGDKDVVNGQVRADARDATNVVLVDKFPNGGAYVSSQSPTGIPAPVVDATARTVTWTIPGPLRPSASDVLQFRVTFRKDDVNSDCETLNNATYTATSNEFPVNDASVRYTVSGAGAATPVVLPLRISSVKATPDPVYFGGQGSLAITVQSFYDKPITGISFNYDLQTNASYLVGSASPTPSSTPPANTAGGRVTWQFDMPAGSKTTPVEKTFTLTLSGGYSTSNVSGGLLQLVPPTNTDLATNCIKTATGRINLRPRLLVKKFTETDPTTKIGNDYIIKRGQEFNYVITVVNRGTTTAQDVDVTDRLPTADGANFQYKVGSSTINGTKRDPDSFVNGRSGTIFWNNLAVAAGTTLTIRYTLIADGYDYTEFCNGVSATSNNSADEGIDYDQKMVCVKINPAIVITKTINGSTGTVAVNPGDEVTFRLTITNNESSVYRVGLADRIGLFTYTKQVSSYDNAEPTSSSGNLLWSLVDLAPGQMRVVEFKARVPADCVSREYENEALFQSANTPGYVIYSIPRVIVKARVNCGKIEYSKTASTDKVSLKDRLTYSIAVRNTDSKAASNVQIEDVLPQGFGFVGMDAGSAITTAPTIATLDDGRLQLVWTLPNVSANATATVKYIALSSIIVGRADKENANLVRTTPGACPTNGQCVSYKDNLYFYRSVEVSPLITAEPKVLPTTCATPGSKRTYQVTVVNTNSHAYTKTTVAVTLPLGLRFVRPISSTVSPSISTNDNGDTMLTWQDMNIPQKPSNAVAAQVQLVVELQVGNVWGDLPTQVQTTSPDGAIPRKDGIVDPIIPVCPTVPSVAKDVDRSVAEAGQEVLYQVSVGNPTGTDMKGVSVEDVLPAGLTFVRQVKGPAPTQSANKLTWMVDVPKAAAADKPGTVILQFKARIAANAAKGTEYTNAATAASGSTALDKTYNSAKTRVVVFVKQYLPIISR